MEAVPRAGVVSRAGGSAADLHARHLPDVASVWQFDVERPAIVLGSRQTVDVLDVEACRRMDVEIVTRRSGGGVVLLWPGASEWIDVVVPATDRRWDYDVSRSMIRIGEVWAAALRDLVDGDLVVHRGPMVRSAWSELVCFAGIAPGEVLLDGAKLVGISQRRNRTAARFQCAINREFDHERLIGLLADPVPTPFPRVATLRAGTGLADRVLDQFAVT